MSENQYRIYFLGDEPDIFNFGKTFYKKKSSFSAQYAFVSRMPDTQMELSELLSGQDCALVMIDFTHPANQVEQLARQLELIKQHKSFRQTVFTGLFKDKPSLSELHHLLHRGLSYTHIKGNDLSLMFEDTFYLAFDENPGFSSYARAKDLQLPYQAEVPGLITEIRSDSLTLNLDLEITNNTLPLRHKILVSDRVDPFSIETLGPNPGRVDALLSYTLNFPYPGPWDEITPESIQRDTIETMLAQEQSFESKKIKALIYSQKDEVFFQLLKLSLQDKHRLYFEQANLDARIFILQPDLIVMDGIPAHEAGELFVLKSLIKAVKSVDNYQPSIIVFNTNISSVELQGTLEYQKVIGHEKEFQSDIFERLLAMSQSKMSKVFDSDLRCIPVSDPKAQAGVKLDLIITGLSEHEITFLCPLEIPMYSNLSFDVPVDCQVLIIPPLRELNRSPKSEHYMGIIHGVDQHQSTYLRKFVNQILFAPLKKFEKIEIKVTAEPVPEMTESTERVSEVLAVEKRPLRARRRSFRKSKL